MELNEIKKQLYKQNPEAMLMRVTKSGIRYSCNLSGNIVTFLIPFEDITDATFSPKEEAKYLIRWILT